MKVYLASKMRGLPSFGAEGFRKAARVLRERGFEVVSPLEMDEDAGIYVDGLAGFEDLADQGFDIRHTLMADLRVVLMDVDAVVLLPGWRDSQGAIAEYATAQAAGVPTWELSYEDEGISLSWINTPLVLASRERASMNIRRNCADWDIWRNSADRDIWRNSADW